MKSKARQDAGKRKSGSLKDWQRDVADACKQLRDQGYKGSLKLKKGSPVYDKAQELKQLRLLASEEVALHHESVPEAPAELRLAAKRGDEQIDVR